jgi:hypothetical protein
MSTKLQERIAALEAELAALKSEANKPEWPWVPQLQDVYFGVDFDGGIATFEWDNDDDDKEMLARFNVYRTFEEAQARAALDLRLSIHAALRQLGGGDEGVWVVRYDIYQSNWVAVVGLQFAPGECVFETESAAKAALEALISGGYLEHGVAK